MPHVDFPFSIERFLKFVSKIAKFSGRAKRARFFFDLSRSPEQSPTRSGSEYKGGHPRRGVHFLSEIVLILQKGGSLS